MSHDLGSFLVLLIDIPVTSQNDLTSDHSVIDLVNQQGLQGILKVS